MTDVSRRRFLHLAAGTAAATTLSAGIARAASIPPAAGSGTLADVEHVVVLMQENRSFDHYFGTLRGVRGFGDPRPLVLPSGKTAFHQAASFMPAPHASASGSIRGSMSGGSAGAFSAPRGRSRTPA